jgi:hypothetical protein
MGMGRRRKEGGGGRHGQQQPPMVRGILRAKWRKSDSLLSIDRSSFLGDFSVGDASEGRSLSALLGSAVVGKN